MSKKGYITNFQDFAVHDGYGLRVILFLKGCRLHCSWCQNPESMKAAPELYYHEKLCRDCGYCIEACPQGALRPSKTNRVDRTKCVKCMTCADICPTGALAEVGKWMTVDEVLQTFVDYKPFFEVSEKGGITLSGGDPTCQPEFAQEVLRRCQEEGIHTAMETCGYVDYETLKGLVQHLDMLMFDIKHMDSEMHKKGTGVPNELIHENLAKIRQDFPDLEIIIRIPLIPGFNDNEENIAATAKFLNSIGIKKLDILPFNFLASGKYDALGVEWVHAKDERQEDEHLARLVAAAKPYLEDVTTDGLR